MARDRLSASDAATGIFAEKLIYALSGAAFIICGLFAAVFVFGKNVAVPFRNFNFDCWLCNTLIFDVFRMRPFTSCLKIYQNTSFFQTLKRTEESLFRFRSLYPKRFLAVFLNFVSYFIRSLKLDSFSQRLVTMFISFNFGICKLLKTCQYRKYDSSSKYRIV